MPQGAYLRDKGASVDDLKFGGDARKPILFRYAKGCLVVTYHDHSTESVGYEFLQPTVRALLQSDILKDAPGVGRALGHLL